MSRRKQTFSPSIVFADFCKPASMRTEPNPPEHDIALAYYRLRDLTLNELSRIIPRWNLRTCDDCTNEMLIRRSADHPNAMMIACFFLSSLLKDSEHPQRTAGRLLAGRLGITEDRVSWQAPGVTFLSKHNGNISK